MMRPRCRRNGRFAIDQEGCEKAQTRCKGKVAKKEEKEGQMEGTEATKEGSRELPTYLATLDQDQINQTTFPPYHLPTFPN